MNTSKKKAAKKKVAKKKTPAKKKVPAKRKPTQEIAVQTDQAPAPTMTDQLLTLAVDKDLDIEKLQRLLDMKDREEEKTARSAFNVAMAAVQSKIEPIVADAENLQTDSKYSKLSTIVNTLAPIYTQHGFSVSFGTSECSSARLIEAGWFRTSAELSHVAGYSKDYFVDLPADTTGIKGSVNKTVIHGTKSAITYARVILLGLMFNFTTSQDVDADGNMPGDTITEEQAAALRDHLSVFDDPANAEKDLCVWLKIESLEQMPVGKHGMAQNAINQQKKADGLK